MSEKSEQFREDKMAKFIGESQDSKLKYFGGSGAYDEENLEKIKKIVDPNDVDAENIDIIEKYQEIKKVTESEEDNLD